MQAARTAMRTRLPLGSELPEKAESVPPGKGNYAERTRASIKDQFICSILMSEH